MLDVLPLMEGALPEANDTDWPRARKPNSGRASLFRDSNLDSPFSFEMAMQNLMSARRQPALRREELRPADLSEDKMR